MNLNRNNLNIVIDLGNSSLKVALFEKKILVEKFIFTNYKFNDISNIFKRNSIKNSIISNVSNLDENIINFLKSNL